MKRLLIHFSRFGPYHYARLRAARKELVKLGWEVIGIEMASSDTTYAWQRSDIEFLESELLTVFANREYESLTVKEIRRTLVSLLDRLRPDAVAMAGWGSPDAQACLNWCRKNGATAIVMSETREVDGQRVWWKEKLKARLIRRFDAALVGGKSHQNYLVKLGMPQDRIRRGYDVVDDAFFEAESKKWKDGTRGAVPPPRPFFLASNRFVARKNLSRLIEAYARYVQNIQSSASDLQHSPLWDLVLLGDGELKGGLIAQCKISCLAIAECAPWDEGRPTGDRKLPTVYFPGFRQIGELPRFYAHAGCFIHPALEEPWGLVINEAMASGLPVLSSSNVGAAEELINEGVNGWTFNPREVNELRNHLVKMAGLDNLSRQQFGYASTRILEERCSTAAFGRGLAVLVT